MKPPSRISIGEVSALTGINPVTLRAWERRYGLIQPQRSGKGHRQYELADIERIHQITAWLDRGVAIGRVRALIDQSRPENAGDGDETPWQEAVSEAIMAIEQLDTRRLEQLFNTLQRQYSLALVLDFWVDALREHLRLLPDQSAAALFQGVLSSFLRAKLGVRLLRSPAGSRRQRIAVVSDQPEAALDALFQAALLREYGLNVFWLDAAIGHDSMPLLMSGRDVAVVLLLLGPATTSTALTRLLGSERQRQASNLLLCGPGLLTLEKLPQGVTALPGDRLAVAEALADRVGEQPSQKRRQPGQPVMQQSDLQLSSQPLLGQQLAGKEQA